MESYWPKAHEDPKATGGMLEFADKFNAIPKIVFSKTLTRADWNNTRLVNTDAVEEVARLKQQPGGNISLGGISFGQEFIRRGMVDEYWLVVQPVVCGSGRRLFEGRVNKLGLRMIGSEVLKSGVVALHYVPTDK